jgi:sec-independent protein translocase protein TatA
MNPLLALSAPGPTEWIFILIIVLVLFGARKLPELARSLGQSMNEFKKAREEFDKELHQAGNDVKPREAQNKQPYQPEAKSVSSQPVQPSQPTQPTQPTQPS